MNSDLISIANAELAEKLRRQELQETSSNKDQQAQEAEGAASSKTKSGAAVDNEGAADSNEKANRSVSFKQDIWKAIYALNIMRYLLAMCLLVFSTLGYIRPEWKPLHPWLFTACTVALLISAVAFTWLSKRKLLNFNVLIVLQFATDIILAGLLVHNFGSIESNFAFLIFVVVATGSVVLPKKQALGLASGAILVLFYEHFHSVYVSVHVVSPNYGLLSQYGVLLMCIAFLVAYLAQRIRVAELKSFVPGNESIEEFLIREEINALRTALAKTHGNKTEAAKLLGMSFRSFRYKLSKYEIS